MIDYTKLPDALQMGARLWIEEGIYPGHFLRAVLENDLTEAFARADDEMVVKLRDIVRWWYNEAPGGCWRGVHAVQEWHALPQSERSRIVHGVRRA
jgi:hypothetical protein